jgi:hypothetical protein
MSLKLVIALTAVVTAVFASTVGAEVIANIDHSSTTWFSKTVVGRIESAGFELLKGGDVDIEAVGMRQPQNRRLGAYAWIINSNTRALVWSMTYTNSSREGLRGLLRRAQESKFLEPGKYELYMYTGDQWNYSGISFGGGKDLYDVLSDLIDNKDEDWEDQDNYDWDRNIIDCFVKVSSDELKPADFKAFTITGDIPGALVAFNRLGDDENVTQGFTLDEPMNIKIYALVEHPNGSKTPCDFGWIVNTATRERVWEIDKFNSERAGGGRKNRVFNDQVRLEKGSYVLHYVTDDSHSWDGFNMEPPYDPMNWGITLLPGTDFKAAAFHLNDIKDERGKPLIDFTRARNNESFEQAFELTKPATLAIYAIGEYSESDRDFADYGWIEDVSTGDAVWEMDRANTDFAGGADKNRMFDGPVELKAGKYIAYYVTDDSHSYRDWNSGAPYDARSYGMAIYGGGEATAIGFRLLDEAQTVEGTNVLARIVRVRDDERLHATFKLDKDTEVHIYAMGEGVDRDMADYGWIEDKETGHTVWEMTYRKTEHAGGADKNRECDDTILLKAGTYVVNYESDGSHSYGDWNQAAPRHPEKWGITVTVADAGAKR